MSASQQNHRIDRLDSGGDHGRKRVGELVAPGSWADPTAHLPSAMDSQWYRMLTMLNAEIFSATADFYRPRGILPVLMPITVGSVSSPMGPGSDSLPVQIDLMGESTYLADSMQFQLEFMLRHGLTGAFYIMPTFRGEQADETHLNQFFHSEAEILGGLEDVMELVEGYLRALTQAVLECAAGAEVGMAAGGVDHLEAFVGAHEVPRITLADAGQLLGPWALRLTESGAATITRAGEQALIEHFRGAVWLTHPPHETVPFYQKVDEHGCALSADLLLGVGEIVGCGERHVTGADVRRSLATHQVPESDYGWYLDMKDHQPLRTAGFGLGLERYLLWVLRHDDIRDLHVMPRVCGSPQSV